MLRLGILLVGFSLPLVMRAEPKNRERISAPVYYEDLMLVVTTDDGVAAIDFLSEINTRKKDKTHLGIEYRFRFLPRGKPDELTGHGRVFECRNIENHGTDFEAAERFIKASPIRIEWSYGDSGKGWIYYVPEQAKVHIAHSKYFERRIRPEPPGSPFPAARPKLQLHRFVDD